MAGRRIGSLSRSISIAVARRAKWSKPCVTTERKSRVRGFLIRWPTRARFDCQSSRAVSRRFRLFHRDLSPRLTMSSYRSPRKKTPLLRSVNLFPAFSFVRFVFFFFPVPIANSRPVQPVRFRSGSKFKRPLLRFRVSVLWHISNTTFVVYHYGTLVCGK